MSTPNPVDVEIFHRISEPFDLPVVQQEKSMDQQSYRIHPLDTQNICTKFSGNPLVLPKVVETSHTHTKKKKSGFSSCTEGSGNVLEMQVLLTIQAFCFSFRETVTQMSSI